MNNIKIALSLIQNRLFALKLYKKQKKPYNIVFTLFV